MDTLVQRQKNKPVIRSTRQFLESWEGNDLGKGTVSKYQRAQGLTWFYRYHYVRPSDGKTCENKKAIGLVKDIGRLKSQRGGKSVGLVSTKTSTRAETN